MSILSNARNDSRMTTRLQQYKRIRDCIEGADRVKAEGRKYLPCPPSLDGWKYNNYKERAVYYPIVDRTIRGMSGMIFRNEVKIELPPLLEPLRTSATPTGAPLHVAIQKATREVLAMGRYGVLLEIPPGADSNTPPQFAPFIAENIIDYKPVYRDGKVVLKEIWLLEDYDDDEVGDAGDEYERQLRLFLNEDGIYEQQVWVRRGADGQKLMKESFIPTPGGSPIDYIPFFFINTNDTEMDEDMPPPMKELADMTLAHYRNSADYEHALYLSAQTTPIITGPVAAKEKYGAIGPNSVWHFQSPDVKVDFKNFDGKGPDNLATAMAKKEEQMGVLGANMIFESKVRNETAETARNRGNAEMSVMASTVNMVESAFLQMLQMAARWLLAREEEVGLEISREWVGGSMPAAEMKTVMEMVLNDLLSHRQMYALLQRYDVADKEVDFEDMLDQIEEDKGRIMGPAPDPMLSPSDDQGDGA